MRVLIADDEPILRFALVNMVASWGFEVIATQNGESALRIAQGENPPEIAMLDWMMPGMDGLDVCRQLRRSPETSYLYVLMLTARSERPYLLEALAAGADELVGKPIDAEELKLRLHTGRRLMSLCNSLRLRATHDALTGLLNRGRIVEALYRECAYAERHGGNLTVAMIDLDDFKQVNDRHGHVEGDVVLREVANRVSAALRGYDSVGRYGGEEFLVLLPGCDAEEGMRVAQRIRREVAETPILTGVGALTQTVSIGVAATSAVLPTPYEVLQMADVALYRAKSLGKNRVEGDYRRLALVPPMESGARLIPGSQRGGEMEVSKKL